MLKLKDTQPKSQMEERSSIHQLHDRPNVTIIKAWELNAWNSIVIVAHCERHNYCFFWCKIDEVSEDVCRAGERVFGILFDFLGNFNDFIICYSQNSNPQKKKRRSFNQPRDINTLLYSSHLLHPTMIHYAIFKLIFLSGIARHASS